MDFIKNYINFNYFTLFLSGLLPPSFYLTLINLNLSLFTIKEIIVSQIDSSKANLINLFKYHIFNYIFQFVFNFIFGFMFSPIAHFIGFWVLFVLYKYVIRDFIISNNMNLGINSQDEVKFTFNNPYVDKVIHKLMRIYVINKYFINLFMNSQFSFFEIPYNLIDNSIYGLIITYKKRQLEKINEDISLDEDTPELNNIFKSEKKEELYVKEKVMELNDNNELDDSLDTFINNSSDNSSNSSNDVKID